jgi:hypothetical protein
MKLVAILFAAMFCLKFHMIKHEKACSNNQHVFMSFAFDIFGFLALEAVDLLKIIQKFMHNNIMSLRSMNIVFPRLSFAIQKILATQLVIRLSFIYV